MTARRLLLIDNDSDFVALAGRELGRYGFDVTVADEAGNPLALVTALQPEIIFIAVEKPDKVGYSLCNKAKKGVAKDIPIVLTTLTEPPEGFRSHRKLKVHADEYIDKRTLTASELLEKVDALVGLGDLVADAGANELHRLTPEVTASSEIEELELDDLEVALDDDEAPAAARMADRGGATRTSAGARTGDDDIDAAVDALADLADPVTRTARATDGPDPEDRTSVASAEDAMRGFGIELAAGDDELGLDEELQTSHRSPAAERDGESTLDIDHADLELDPGPVTAAPTAAGRDRIAAPEPSAITSLPSSVEQVAVLARATGTGRRAAVPPPAGSGRPDTGEGLPLDEIGDGTMPGARPDEALAARDREAEGMREELRQLGHARAELEDRLRTQQELIERERATAVAERARADQLIASRDAIGEELAAARAETERAISATAAELEAARAAAENERSRAIADVERRHAAALAALREELGRERAEAERALVAAAEARARQQEEAHAAALARAGRGTEEARAELDRRIAEAVAGAETRAHDEMAAAADRHQRELAELEAAHQRALSEREVDRRNELTELSARHDRNRQALEDQHAGQLLRVAREHGDAGQRQTAAHEAQLAAAEQRRLAERAEDDARREREAAELEVRLVDELAAADDRHQRELAAIGEQRAADEVRLQARFEAERAALREEHDEATAALEARIAEAEATAASTRERLGALGAELAEANAQSDSRAERIAALEHELGARDERLAGLGREIADLEQQNAAYQEQVLRAYQRLKRDEATAARAKKALAIALTLLDDADAARALDEADQ